MRPRFPDLPKRSRIVREDPTAEEAYFSNDISFRRQHGVFPFSSRSASVLVVGAPEKSGSPIRAEYVLEGGKEVFPVPNPIHMGTGSSGVPP